MQLKQWPSVNILTRGSGCFGHIDMRVGANMAGSPMRSVCCDFVLALHSELELTKSTNISWSNILR